jgi:hypothetical protein
MITFGKKIYLTLFHPTEYGARTVRIVVDGEYVMSIAKFIKHEAKELLIVTLFFLSGFLLI